MATYQIPIKWNGDTGTVLMDYHAGNTIAGTWSSARFSCTVKIEELTQYWNSIKLGLDLNQGGVINTYKYDESGRYYPGRTYSVPILLDKEILQASKYTWTVKDIAEMFDGQIAKPSHATLEVTKIEAEKPRNFTVDRKEIYEDIRVKFEMTSNNKVVYEIWQDGNKIGATASTNGREILIKKGTLKSTSNVLIKAYSTFIPFGSTSINSEIVQYTLSGLKGLVATKATNTRALSKQIFENIIIKCDTTAEHTYAWQVFVNEQLKINTAYGLDQATIPYGTIKSKDDAVRIEVVSKRVRNGYTAYSEKVIFSLSGLQELIAEKPSNLRIIGTQRMIEENIPFAWDTIDMNGMKSELEIWQDGANKYSENSITNKQFTLSAGTLKSTNDIELRVRNIKSYHGYKAVSAYTTLRVNDLGTLTPTIHDFSLSGTNRDYLINVIPDAIGATGYIVNGINGLVINRGILAKGINPITLTAYAISAAGIRVESTLKKTFDIAQDEPRVYSLEPSGLNINIENPSSISFATNEFINRWELSINHRTYTQGTLDRVVPIPKNTFIKGINYHKIKVYYSPTYNVNDIRTHEIEVSFMGYGKPQAVELDSTEVYNTATPTFTWISGTSESDSQTSFEIEIKDKGTGHIVEEKTVVTTLCSYTVMTPLENNKEYIVQVSVKNKYDMWSNWSAKTIQTNFNNLPIPILTLSHSSTGVTIKIDAYQPTNFKEIKVYRRDDLHTEWICIAHNLNADETLTDFVPQPNTQNYYKARLYDDVGGFSESKEYSTLFNLRHYKLNNVENFESSITLKGAIAKIKPNKDYKTKIFSGDVKPIVYAGNTNYFSGIISYTTTIEGTYELEQFIKNSNIFCYRDWRGRKFYCFATITDIAYESAKLNTIEILITEVRFNETNMFTGKGYKKIVYLNGEYKLDGSIDMSGYDPKATRQVIYYAKVR